MSATVCLPERVPSHRETYDQPPKLVRPDRVPVDGRRLKRGDWPKVGGVSADITTSFTSWASLSKEAEETGGRTPSEVFRPRPEWGPKGRSLRVYETGVCLRHTEHVTSHRRSLPRLPEGAYVCPGGREFIWNLPGGVGFGIFRCRL